MSYAKQTINNRSLIKRFSHGKRFEVAIDLIKQQQPRTILDYGTGNGHLLIELEAALPKVQLVGYDPIPSMFEELQNTMDSNPSDRIEITNHLESLTDRKFDVVSCQEVLEHFDESHQMAHIRQLKSHLSNNGTIVISVPLETGFSALIKNFIRFVSGQKHSNSSPMNILKSILGIKVNRKGDPYIHSHIGFNHKLLERQFEQEGLTITKKYYSPLPIFRTLLNSQIFYILKNKKAF